ncbi:MAG: carboxymuconolactone decarboxylase family protein [Xanthobacteraceae bacterium]
MKPLKDRMPPLPDDQMDAVQRAAAAELIAGPRKGVKGPFIPLLRSPDLMARLQKVGEYLRFDSTLQPRISEFATLVVARHWTQQFEWHTHVPLALKAGTQQSTIDALRDGARPDGMSTEEALVYDFACELAFYRGVCDETYRAAVEAFGERGVIDLVGIIGYFTWVSMVLNVAHTPPEPAPAVAALSPTPR